MTRAGPASADGWDDVAGSPTYRLLLLSLRAAWLLVGLAVLAMLPALVLVSPVMAAAFQLLLWAGLGSCLLAVALFVPLVLRADRYGLGELGSLGARADVLVAALLMDLLDGG